MKYIEKYNRYIDNDCVIYRFRKGDGKFVQVKPSVNNCGYEFICYKQNKIVYVHRLVYEAFKGEISEGLEIDHIDRNRRNNNPENLRLVTRIENMQNTCIGGEFGRKFKEQFGIEGSVNKDRNLYERERKWYKRHNNTCRWEA